MIQNQWRLKQIKLKTHFELSEVMAIVRFDFAKAKKAIVEREAAKMLLAVEHVEAEAKHLCPVDKGNMIGLFGHDVRVEGNEIIGTVRNTASYAAAVEFGSKPHVIEPRDKKVLSFMADGKRIFAKIVHHPGFAGIPFLRGAMYSSKRRILELLRLQ